MTHLNNDRNYINFIAEGNKKLNKQTAPVVKRKNIAYKQMFGCPIQTDIFNGLY